jgi:hypothetical protein
VLDREAIGADDDAVVAALLIGEVDQHVVARLADTAQRDVDVVRETELRRWPVRSGCQADHVARAGFDERCLHRLGVVIRRLEHDVAACDDHAGIVARIVAAHAGVSVSVSVAITGRPRIDDRCIVVTAGSHTAQKHRP